MIPAWLRRHLNDTGVTVNGIGRRATLHPCPKCGRHVLQGLTAEPCSTSVTADITPLSNLGEALALTSGRRTYDLAYRCARLELDLRDDFQIGGSPPETPDWWRAKSDVLAEHRCNTPPLPAIGSRIP